MKRLILACVIPVLVLVLLPSVARAQAGGAVRVTAERTSVRDRAATDGGVVASVARGDQMQVLEVSGSWFRVRVASGQEGFVHSLFVERIGGAAAPAVAAPPPPGPASGPIVTSAGSSSTVEQSNQGAGPRLPGDGSAPLGNRRFGFGLANIGPSVRYWMDAKKGFQVDGYFTSAAGFSVMAISPSFIMRFKEPKAVESVSFMPYWGAGATIWRFDDGYNDFYCGQFADCSSSSIGFGGFVGGEMVFESLPKLAISGNVGYYTAALGYGGIGAGVGIHFYPGAR